METALPQKAVQCECPEEFVLKTLQPLPGYAEMSACGKCGRADLANALVSEPRPYDTHFHGYSFFDISEAARAWASAWPRYVEVNYVWVYLPAASRFESAAELNAAVASAAERQSGLAFREILLAAGIPSSGPPASLPKELNGFTEIWNGLRLNDETPAAELLDAATRFNGPHRLAKDVLTRRTDLQELAVTLLSDAVEKRRDGARYLVKTFRLTGADIVGAIRGRLRKLGMKETTELYGISELFREMGEEARSAVPDLEAAARRVKDDYYTHKYVIESIEALKGKAG
jgi:hypothetical protein